MGRIIVVTSGKGGVGKTTCTASIGTALAQKGNRVLLIDADVGLNNLDVLMGVDNRVVYDMLDVLSGKCRVKQALIGDSNLPNLYILPSAHAYQSEDISIKSFRCLIERLAEGFDFILIDCPAGIEKGFHRAVSPAQEAIIVTTPNISSLRDADKVLGILRSYTLTNINLVINRVRGDLMMRGDIMSPEEISKLLKYMPIGVVPEDDSIQIYSELGRMSENNNIARQSYNCIADNLLTGRRRLYDPTACYRGMIGKIKLIMKRAQ